MKSYEKPSPQDHSIHYGVKNTRWGVRRYQNYDGSYTRRGLERHRKVELNYEHVKSRAAGTEAVHKSRQATWQRVEDTNQAVKTEKRRMEDAYGKLKTDKSADEGKRLYQHDKTITGNTQTAYLAEVAIVVGSRAAGSLLSRGMEDQRTAQPADSATAVGGTIVNALLAEEAIGENGKLRAFYIH